MRNDVSALAAILASTIVATEVSQARASVGLDASLVVIASGRGPYERPRPAPQFRATFSGDVTPRTRLEFGLALAAPVSDFAGPAVGASLFAGVFYKFLEGPVVPMIGGHAGLVGVTRVGYDTVSGANYLFLAPQAAVEWRLSEAFGLDLYASYSVGALGQKPTPTWVTTGAGVRFFF